MRDRLPVLIRLFGSLMLLAPGLAGAGLPTGFQEEILVPHPSVRHPVSLAFLPDTRILVVEQISGAVRLIVGATAVSVDTIPDVNSVGAEQGLLGVAVDPGWPGRPYLYFYFDRTPGNAIYLSRFTVTGDLANSSSTNLAFSDRYDMLTDIPDTNIYHNGGTLRFGSDGMLYASVGDDGYPCLAQEVNRFHGKILRLDVSGLPAGPGGPPAKSLLTPADNPFVGQGSIAGLVFALGLRNPYRFNVDPLTGRLYVGDVGLDNWEELDEVVRGDNCGWPFREGPVVFTLPGCSEPGGTGTQSYKDPIAWYYRGGQGGSRAIVAGPMYRHVSGGTRNFPFAYDGAVFFGDFYVGFWRLTKRTFGGDWDTLAVPGQADSVNWATSVIGVSDMLVGPDGALYYTKRLGESLRRIVYTGPPVTGAPEPRTPSFPHLLAYPNPLRSGGKIVLQGVLPEGAMRVLVFDARGRLIREVPDAKREGEGILLPANALSGSDRPAPGVYFIRLSGEHRISTTRLVVLP